MKIAVLGGTGFLGCSLKMYTPSRVIIEQFSHSDYDADNFASNEYLAKRIIDDHFDAIVDFTRNTKLQLMTFKKLIGMIPNWCSYVNISTYGLMFKGVFNDSYEYLYVKSEIENGIRPNDFSLRTPFVIDCNKNIIDYRYNVDGDYVFYINNDEYVRFLLKMLDSTPGLYICPSRRYVFK